MGLLLALDASAQMAAEHPDTMESPQSLEDVGAPGDRVVVEIYSDSPEPGQGRVEYVLASDGHYHVAYGEMDGVWFDPSLVTSMWLYFLGTFSIARAEMGALTDEDLLVIAELTTKDPVFTGSTSYAGPRAWRTYLLGGDARRVCESDPLGRGGRIWNALKSLLGYGRPRPGSAARPRRDLPTEFTEGPNGTVMLSPIRDPNGNIIGWYDQIARTRRMNKP